MKTRTRLAASLLSLCTVSFLPALHASPQKEPGLVHPVEVVNIDGRKLTLGATENQVLQVLGRPSRTRVGDPAAKLEENIWMYRNLEGTGANGPCREDDCHTLLVTMIDKGNGRGWRVAEMKLVNTSAEVFYTAQIKARTADTMVAVR